MKMRQVWSVKKFLVILSCAFRSSIISAFCVIYLIGPLAGLIVNNNLPDFSINDVLSFLVIGILAVAVAALVAFVAILIFCLPYLLLFSPLRNSFFAGLIGGIFALLIMFITDASPSYRPGIHIMATFFFGHGFLSGYIFNYLLLKRNIGKNIFKHDLRSCLQSGIAQTASDSGQV